MAGNSNSPAHRSHNKHSNLNLNNNNKDSSSLNRHHRDREGGDHRHCKVVVVEVLEFPRCLRCHQGVV